jgi:hypothetical protein
MSELQVTSISFAEYKYSSGDWVEWTWSGSDVYGKIKSRAKGSITVDGNTISGDDGENVYKMGEYDPESEEMTGQDVAKPESSLSKWGSAPDMSASKSPAEIEQEVSEIEFMTQEDKQEIFEMWSSMTNMSEEEMEMWDEHPCADAGVDGGENTRDTTLMLMGQAPDGWNPESYRVANKQLAHIAEAMEMDVPDDAASGGEGSCPSRWTVNLLNRGVNPLEEMPAGNPSFSVNKGQNGIDLPSEDLTDFEEHDELDEVYSQWSDEVNMSASQLESWADHDCADEASQNPSRVRERNMMLLETNKSDWGSDEIKAAKRTISFISRMRGQRPDSPSEGGTGSCPSEWSISLLNWAYNPFDGMPSGTPDPEQENAADDESMTFSAHAVTPRRKDLKSDFNEHGVRENYDDNELKSVDAVYEAMEPGPPDRRNGVRITKEFLQTVADKEYDEDPPYLMDHDKSTLSQIGRVKDVWYDENAEKLMLMARTFNTGSPTHEEIISRLTFEPPTLTDGSIGFGKGIEMSENDEGESVLTDGRIREFSTTPFPAGYDDGGLAAQ